MKNLIEKIDIISSNIDLRYKGRTGYKTVIGGMLSLFVYILTFAVSIFFSFSFLARIDPKSYTVKKFLESGGAQMNQKNLFHFFTIADLANGTAVLIDLDKYKDILSVNAYVTVSYNMDFIQYNYDRCVLEDFDGIENFYNDIIKDYYFCIRKMKDLRTINITNNESDNKNLNWKVNLIESDNQEKVIIENNKINNHTNKKLKLNPEFIYPWMTIEKPEDMINIKYFRIKITKCQNSTDKNYFCKPENEIDEKISLLYLQLKFIDNMFDVGNYKEPISKYINNKSVAIKKDTLSNLYLNFMAVKIVSRDGFIFDSTTDPDSYAFDFHSEAFTETKGNVIHLTEFWILNNAQNYERSYPKLQNIAAEIGGLYRFFIIGGSLINFIFEKYINFNINDNLLDVLNVKCDESKSLGKIHESIPQKINLFKNILEKDLNKKIEFSRVNNKKDYVLNENFQSIMMRIIIIIKIIKIIFSHPKKLSIHNQNLK